MNKKYRPFDKHSKRMEFDWNTDDVRMDTALKALLKELPNDDIGNTNIFQKNLRVILVACSRVEKYFPGIYLAYPRGSQGNKCIKNPLKIKPRSFFQAIDLMSESGFLENHQGYNGTLSKRRQSRFKASDKLISIIKEHGLNEVSFKRELLNGGIILKNNEKEIVDEFETTKEIKRSQNILSRYNDFIEDTKIILDIEKSVEPYFYDSNLSYRIFNNSSFSQGGRFYGGWWLQCKKEERPHIKINGYSTVELDYKANHLCFIYALEGVKISYKENNDLYSIDDIPREIIKCIFNFSINCDSKIQAYKAVRKHIRISNDNEKHIWGNHIENHNDFSNILYKIIERHPLVKNHLFKSTGVRLTYLDSQVAEYVIDNMMDKGVPILCIHDSFIVQKDREKELYKCMTNAYNYIGYPNHVPIIEKKR